MGLGQHTQGCILRYMVFVVEFESESPKLEARDSSIVLADLEGLSDGCRNRDLTRKNRRSVELGVVAVSQVRGYGQVDKLKGGRVVRWTDRSGNTLCAVGGC